MSNKKPLIWIIDEEWPDYELEKEILFGKYPDCDLRFSTYDYQKDLEEFGKDADAVICQVYAPIPGQVIKQLGKCKIIAVYGGGYDRVDVKAAKEKGIKVTNVSGYCAKDLSDYVMAAVFTFNKQFAFVQGALYEGKWGAGAVEEKGRRIKDSTLLIVGCGTIGGMVAKKAVAHRMNVIAFDPYKSAEYMEELGVKKVETLEEGMRQADYVSINTILTAETTGLITYRHLALLKPGACLVNTARGKVIVEEDLVRALEKGVLRAAMLDVISVEPPTYEEAVFRCASAYVTPHISYISKNSFDELKKRTSDNVITVLEGGIPKDWVNQ